MSPITLRAGDAGLVLAPAVGGSIARYWRETATTPIEWLRPAAADADSWRDAYGMAAFSLVPYSNRIREGRFAFRGRQVRLPLNCPPMPHSIHGHGWQAAWHPVAVDAAQAEIEYRHPAGAWPWAYRARQRIALSATRLTVDLTLTNEGETTMPAGLGWHPYFVRTPRATLSAGVTGLWLTDGETMPTALVPPPPGSDPSRGIQLDAVVLDNCFTGWSRRAVVAWPERGARLVVTAEGPLDFLVVYTPPGEPFFCAEPVSHVTDAFNLAAAGRSDTGLRSLGPGESLAATITLTPEGR
jgi:aldose 1-epimerase